MTDLPFVPLPASMTALEVRDKAVQLVNDHAARLGMDAFAAATLIRVIHALPVAEAVPAGDRAAKAKGRLIEIEIPRDELALRIAQPCLGMIAPAGAKASQALDDMDRAGGPVLMGTGFRRAADQAVLFFHECINAGEVAN